MKLGPRMLRRMIIAIIFVTVFFVTGMGLKRITEAPPTCTDGKMNGQEEGVDCGAIACGKYCEPELEPPKIISTKLIKAGDRDYDFVAEVLNPHRDFGASEVVYELSLLNAGGEELLKRGGVFYILPGQSKFLILPYLTTESKVASIDLKIKSAKWQKIDALEGMNLIVRREKYNIYGGGASSTLDAVIFNDSDFDFDRIDIDVILRNSRGEIIAVNKSDIRTFLARTERAFQVTWPFPIMGSVGDTDIRPSTNLFENLNFVKRYGSEIEQFQEY